MTKESAGVEERLAEQMEASVSNIHASDDLIAGVRRRRRVLRRRRVTLRIATASAAVVAVGAIAWAVRSTPDPDTVLSGDIGAPTREPAPVQSASTALVGCLRRAGLPVDSDGESLVFVAPPVSLETFESAYLECTARDSSGAAPDEEQLRAQALAEFDRAARRFETERAARAAEDARVAAEQARIEAERVAALDTAQATAEESAPRAEAASTTSPGAAPRRFVLAERDDGITVNDIVDRDGGVVSVVFVGDMFPGVTLQLHVVPGEYAEPPTDFDPEPIDVRATTGVIVRPPDGSLSLLWQEDEALAIELSATPTGDSAVMPTSAELVEVANRILEVDESDWVAYRARYD